MLHQLLFLGKYILAFLQLKFFHPKVKANYVLEAALVLAQSNYLGTVTSPAHERPLHSRRDKIESVVGALGSPRSWDLLGQDCLDVRVQGLLVMGRRLSLAHQVLLFSQTSGKGSTC